MKNKTSFFANCILTVLLIFGLLWCCITSFSVEVNPVVVITSTVLFTGLFAVISVYIASRRKFLLSIAVIGIVFIFTLLFSLEAVLDSANYVVNCILKSYSQFMSVPSVIWFSSNKANNADAFFVAVSFVLSMAFVFSLVRLKRIIIVVGLSVLCLVPSFVLVTTLPSLIPLILVVSSLFALYLTTFMRKNNQGQNGVALIISTMVMLVTAIIICIFIPVENYEREEWQDNLLDFAQELTGIESGHRSSDGTSALIGQDNQTFSDNEKLDEIGPFEKKGKKIMEFLSYETGNVYLKAVAYGNYNNNEWSVLTDEQLDSLPENYNTFTMTQARSSNTTPFSIKTENEDKIAYTPYYTSAIPEGFSTVGDVFVKNNDKLKSYSIDNISKSYNDEFFIKLDSNYMKYCEFVENNYISLPEELKEKILEIGSDNGISVLDSEEEMDSSTKSRLIREIKNFVSNHGSYSLLTKQMPEGKEFPVWFLEESDTGYCIHYATAAAVMLRAYGIPARYVAGFYVKATNGEWTEVNSDNAHAWVEYFDEDIGWVPLEATPASFSPSGAAEDLEITTLPPTQARTEPETAMTTEAPTSIVTEPETTNTVNTDRKTDEGTFNSLIFAITIVLIAVLAVFVRRSYIILLRRNHFSKGGNNSKAIHIYRYIKKLDRFSKNVIPNEITEIAHKAKFSRHTVEIQEVAILLSYADDAKKELLKNSSCLRRIYLNFVIVI